VIDALAPGEPLSFGGFQTEAPNGVPVDFVRRDDDYAPLYEEALSRATTMPDVIGPYVRIVRLEYIAAMKMVAGRARDHADLEWIVLRSGADLPKTRRIVKQYLGTYAAQEFDRLVEEARWRASRGRAE
jgi:hypothetical protein